MDTARILHELRIERDRIQKAIDALENLTSTSTQAVARPASKQSPKGKRTMSAAARRKISESAKKRWAERKQGAAAKPRTSAKQATPKRTKGGLTTAGRKRLSELMRKRWAERRKSASKAA